MRARPAIDPRFAAAVEASGMSWDMLPATIERRRARPQPTAAVLAGLRNEVHEHDVAGVPVTLVLPVDSPESTRPLVLFAHGGGMVTGTRYSGLDRVMRWLPSGLGAVVASPEYRLAPEHPDPAPADDCWSALTGLVAEAGRWGIDPSRVLLVGSSAGGALAAGLALRAKDAGGPALHGLMLLSPMLDDRDETESMKQYVDGVPWTRASNRTAWDALLGAPRREPVSHYAVPARAADLSGLPDVYIDTTSAEVFRDEDVQFASRLWSAGVQTELHVWPGAVHGFDALVPDHPITAMAHAARTAWVTRLMERLA